MNNCHETKLFRRNGTHYLIKFHLFQPYPYGVARCILFQEPIIKLKLFRVEKKKLKSQKIPRLRNQKLSHDVRTNENYPFHRYLVITLVIVILISRPILSYMYNQFTPIFFEYGSLSSIKIIITTTTTTKRKNPFQGKN